MLVHNYVSGAEDTCNEQDLGRLREDKTKHKASFVLCNCERVIFLFCKIWKINL